MLSDEVKQYLVKRAEQSNVLDRIEFEPVEFGSDKSYFQITGIFGGALDEEFVVSGMYEINVADWLAEVYMSEDSPETWMIDVYQFCPGALVECAGEDECDGEHDDEIGDMVYRLMDGLTIMLAVDDAGLENPR